jgi:cysteine desulfurase
VRNGDPSRSLPNTLNASFPGADGESLLMGLDLEGICVSSGSACMVGAIQASHVLLAMGVDASTALATVRFSMGATTTAADIDHTVEAVARVVGLQTALAA